MHTNSQEVKLVDKGEPLVDGFVGGSRWRQTQGIAR